MQTSLKENDTATINNNIEDEIDIFNLFIHLWQGRRILFVSIIISLLLGCTYAILTPPRYGAKSTVIINSKSKSSNVLNKLGGLAELAGVSPASESDSNNYLLIIQSLTFMMQFIEQKKLLPIIYKNCWEHKTQKWVNGCATSPPSTLHAARRIKQAIKFKVDNRTGLITISTNHSNPERAAQLINSFIIFSNERLRETAREKTKTNISFFTSELKQTQELEIRNTLYRALEKEIQTKKLIGNEKEYAFKIIDKAYTPESRTHPKRTKIALTSAFLGLFIGIGLLFSRSALSNIRQRITDRT